MTYFDSPLRYTQGKGSGQATQGKAQGKAQNKLFGLRYGHVYRNTA